MAGGGYHIPARIPRLVYARCPATRSLRLILAETDVRLAASPPPRSLLYPRSTWAVHVRATDTPPTLAAAPVVAAVSAS
jgi:hypothetical protein